MPQGKNRIAKTAAVLSGLAIASLLALLAATAGFSFLNAPPSHMPESALFTVGKGSSGSAVAQELQAKGLIKSSLFLRLAMRLNGKAAMLKSGTYRITKGMGSMSIIDMIVAGKQATVRVTIPEGFTKRQVASLLESKGVCAAEAFLKASSAPSLLSSAGIPFADAEGFLFPDTYDFPLNSGAEEAAASMVKAFFAALREELPDAPAPGSADFRKNLILASIIEREYRVDSEAPLMSSVFHNRLRLGMALQSCATVVYVITERQGRPHPKVLYARDIAIQDDYNTYAHNGLPPGPISNPGRTALIAAFKPARTKYLYFRLADEERGNHFFSETLSEHNQAGGLSVKRQAGRK